MQHTTPGNTGLTISRLAFGAMTVTQGNRDIAAIHKVGAGSKLRWTGDLRTALRRM
jgi:hypothetical protein